MSCTPDCAHTSTHKDYNLQFSLQFVSTRKLTFRNILALLHRSTLKAWTSVICQLLQKKEEHNQQADEIRVSEN